MSHQTNPSPEALIDGHLDGILTSDETSLLNEWIQADPANALAFSRRVRLHSHLRDLAFQTTLEPENLTTPPKPRHRWPHLRLAGALVITVAMAAWALFLQPVSAARELDRLIAANTAEAAAIDRTYRIRSLDEIPEAPDPKRPPIDGATLWVRAPDNYVLIRSQTDGSRWITGSDGETGWSVPPDGQGAVRVSRDPMRFRGPVPGHQTGIPFANLPADLAQLRNTYDLTLLKVSPEGWKGLLARKRSTWDRGPREVEIRFDSRTGIIHRMTFHGMPKARGGPDSVMVELVGMESLDPVYFRHEFHHAANRRVVWED